MTEFRLAFSFLTRLPVFAPEAPVESHAGATRYYPVVGAIMAVLVLGALFTAAWTFDRTTGVVVALIAWTLLSGGLHLDGLADCFDGLGVQGTHARVLQVMRDSRVGAFAVVGLVLWLLLKFALLARCVDAGNVAQAVWCAMVAARAPLAFELREGSPASPGEGVFSWLHPEVRREDWTIAFLFAAALLIPACAPFGPVLVRAAVGLVLGAFITVGWHLIWFRRIGGLNGDVLGGAIEIREVAMLVAMAAQLPW